VSKRVAEEAIIVPGTHAAGRSRNLAVVLTIAGVLVVVAVVLLITVLTGGDTGGGGSTPGSGGY
jgi:hypothetical protein